MGSILLAIGLLVAVLVPVGVLVYTKIRATEEMAKRWKPVAGHFGTRAIINNPEVSSEVLGARLTQALLCLKLNTGWSPTAIEAVSAKLSITVNAVNAWQDSSGQWVGGQEIYYSIAVGADLSALLHEVAHVCEFAIDGKVDELHQNWPTNGIAKADEAYRKLLMVAVVTT